MNRREEAWCQISAQTGSFAGSNPDRVESLAEILADDTGSRSCADRAAGSGAVKTFVVVAGFDGCTYQRYPKGAGAMFPNTSNSKETPVKSVQEVMSLSGLSVRYGSSVQQDPAEVVKEALETAPPKEAVVAEARQDSHHLAKLKANMTEHSAWRHGRHDS